MFLVNYSFQFFKKHWFLMHCSSKWINHSYSTSIWLWETHRSKSWGLWIRSALESVALINWVWQTHGVFPQQMKVSQARGSNTLPVIITPRPAHKHTIPHPKSKNMSYPSGFIIFRVPESLHQHSQAHVCCEMRHVMTCTFIWGSTGSANSAQSPHGIQAGILWHARAVSLYRANNPIKTSQVTPLFICVRVSIRCLCRSTGLGSA